MSEEIKHAINVLTYAMEVDSYLWSWHCNLAVMFQDAGCDYHVSQDGAARFLKLAFNSDVTKLKEYKEVMKRI